MEANRLNSGVRFLKVQFCVLTATDSNLLESVVGKATASKGQSERNRPDTESGFALPSYTLNVLRK